MNEVSIILFLIAVIQAFQLKEMFKMRQNWEEESRFHRSHAQWEKQMVERKYKEQQCQK